MHPWLSSLTLVLSRWQRRIKITVFVFSVMFILLVGMGYSYLMSPLQLSSALEMTIEHGDTLSQVSTDLSLRGVLPHPFWLRLYAKTQPSVLKAGHYRLLPGMTVYQCFRLLTGGLVTTYRVMLPVGIRVADMLAILRADPHLVHDMTMLTMPEIAHRLGLSTTSMEGEFLPNTYFFPEGAAESGVLLRAHHAMVLTLQHMWSERDPHIMLTTSYDALILASIVERETMDRDEMPVIAGVFYNRLHKGMPLQADSTVSVGANKAFWLPITKADLANKSLYNTYRNLGLPPSPIALVSRSALYAVLHPAQTPYLYFIAKGDGRSVFSATYRAHRGAVKQYLRRSHG